jgi:predicted O-methyltransferase YrrM
LLSDNASIDKDELILQEIESKGEQQFLPIIGREKGQVLVNVIHDVKPKRVLEVGTLIGYSSVLIGRELLRMMS